MRAQVNIGTFFKKNM